MGRHVHINNKSVPVYFLLNDTVFDIDPEEMLHPLEQNRFDALSLDYIALLGKEMFADDPNAHKLQYERARRLCYLIMLKDSDINAAQFFATSMSKKPEDVDCEFKSIDDEIMDHMLFEQAQGRLSTIKVDPSVWNRLAA